MGDTFTLVLAEIVGPVATVWLLIWGCGAIVGRIVKAAT